MSRIDEALKRARARRSGDGEGPEKPTAGIHVVDSPVVPAWQYERFPPEEDRRRPAEMPPATDRTRKLPVRHMTRGVAPRFAEKVVGGRAAASSREQYARVAAALHHAQVRQKTKVVLVASAVPGEGKTLTAANVALTLSESYGRRVLLIDADLRRPTLHELFQVPGTTGLLDGLEAGAGDAMSLIEVSPRLSVLPAGRATTDPMRLLISEQMHRVLLEAAEVFDWVIVDTPPLALVPDAHVLAEMVHAAVMVIRAGSTPCDLISAAVQTLGKQRILGVVLNGVEDRDMAGGHGRYGYGYGYGPNRD